MASIISRYRKQLTLPLLSKELTEQANRRRTYMIRTLYALTVSIVAIGGLYDINYDMRPFAMLGRGGQLVQALTFTQFFGVYFLLPSMTCAVLTHEKERNTLELLLLTKLGPWIIIFEKMLSRMVPMLVFILLTLPVLGMAYAMGGTDGAHLMTSLYFLVLASLQVCSIAIACSAFAANSSTSFVITHLSIFAVVFGPVLIDEMRWINIRDEEMLFPPVLFDQSYRTALVRGIEESWVCWVQIILTLGLTRYLLVKRAFAKQTKVGTQILRNLDVVMSSITWPVRRLFALRRNEPVFDEPAQTSLPIYDPISWRDRTKTFLGKRTHRRYMCGFVLMFLAYIYWEIFDNWLYSGRFRSYRYSEERAAVYFLFLAFVAMTMMVKATSIITSERSRQTLDVILSTPISNRDFLKQKLQGAFNFERFFALPFAFILAAEIYWAWQANSTRSEEFEISRFSYVVYSVVTAYVLLHLITWIAALMGLICKTQIQALVCTMVVCGGMAIGPFVCFVILWEFLRIRPDAHWAFLFLSSPATFPTLLEFDDLDELELSPVITFIFNTAIYGGFTRLLKHFVLSQADRFLKRSDETEPQSLLAASIEHGPSNGKDGQDN
ncbi:MAG: hypothetical protein CMJ78_22645 [Planctomycetaceae bacterium]|nr:hypothetical protein [Planctomycetaceae bacterium]